MKTEYVISLDPGERTGWASARMGPDHLELVEWGTMPRKQMGMWLAAQQGVAQLATWMNLHSSGSGSIHLAPPTYDRIVYESWKPRRQNGSMDWIEGDNLLSARHVGHIELIAWLAHTDTTEFGPHKKKGFQRSMPPQLVAAQRGSSEQHPKDAIMHLWGYFFTQWFSATKDPELCVVA